MIIDLGPKPQTALSAERGRCFGDIKKHQFIIFVFGNSLCL